MENKSVLDGINLEEFKIKNVKMHRDRSSVNKIDECTRQVDE
jgi:hypothetical protein